MPHTPKIRIRKTRREDSKWVHITTQVAIETTHMNNSKTYKRYRTEGITSIFQKVVNSEQIHRKNTSGGCERNMRMRGCVICYYTNGVTDGTHISDTGGIPYSTSSTLEKNTSLTPSTPSTSRSITPSVSSTSTAPPKPSINQDSKSGKIT